MLFKRLRSILLPLAVSLPLSALAGPFSSLVVFGDSLSDTGNLGPQPIAVANSRPRARGERWYAGPGDVLGASLFGGTMRTLHLF